MRFEIRHQTRFDYGGRVAESQNELRSCPATDDDQQLLHYHVTVDPTARTNAWTDYWGTRVDAFGVRPLHEQLTVVAEATVETRPRPPAASDAIMDDLRDLSFRDDHYEYLQPTRTTTPPESLVAAVRDLVPAGGSVLDVVDAIVTWTSQSLAYRPGATFVGTTTSEALDAGAGVCQDLAHVAAAACRTLGIPSRYVSGYLFTQDDQFGEDVTDAEVVVETHAWFEAAVPGAGWVPRDPTNLQPVGERHIVVGRGRDYHDVPPLRGSFSGPGAASLEVEVRVRRLAATEQQQQQQ